MSPIISKIPAHDVYVYTVVWLGYVRTEVHAQRYGHDNVTVATCQYKFVSEAQVRNIHAAITDLWDRRGWKPAKSPGGRPFEDYSPPATADPQSSTSMAKS